MIFNMISSGGGASAPRFGIATGEPTSTEARSLSFTNLLGEPQAFCAILVPKGKETSIYIELNTGDNNRYYISHFVYDGVEIRTVTIGKDSKTDEGNINIYGNGYNAENNAYSFVYSNGTLTISVNSNTINNGRFHDGGYVQYELLYIY